MRTFSFPDLKIWSRLGLPSLLLILLWGSLSLSALAKDGAYIQVKFFSDKLTLPAMPEMYKPLTGPLNERMFRDVYTHFQESEFYPLLKKVGDYRRGMNLSDWHYYDVIARYSELIFPDGGRNFQVLFQWFMLRKSGIDVRLFYTPTDVYLNARTEDIEFGFYIIEQDGRKYANLTAKREGITLKEVSANMPSILMDSATMPFSMKLAQMPRLMLSDTIERLIEFVHKGEKHQIKVNLNKNWLDLMDSYPYYNQRNYFEIGMSREAENSLIPALEKLMGYKTDVEKVELLLSFTRTAFFYKDDNWRYGKEKPMTPEETLYHSYSDCEDRSALFFYLCKKLIGLPTIVLDFQTHVGVAVVLEGVDGDFYKYKDRRFVYCEPTGPQDILLPGQMWDKVREQNARILVEYIPQ